MASLAELTLYSVKHAHSFIFRTGFFFFKQIFWFCLASSNPAQYFFRSPSLQIFCFFFFKQIFWFCSAPFAQDNLDLLSETPSGEDIDRLLYGNPDFYSVVREHLDSLTNNEEFEELFDTWKEANWFVSKWFDFFFFFFSFFRYLLPPFFSSHSSRTRIPMLFELITEIDYQVPELSKTIFKTIREICSRFGQSFSEVWLNPIFISYFDQANHLEGEDDQSKQNRSPLFASPMTNFSCKYLLWISSLIVLVSRLRVLPAYINGFLSVWDKNLFEFIKNRHIAISVEEMNWLQKDINSLSLSLSALW